MNLEIHKPELVERVTAHIQAGHFRDAEELIEKALDALDHTATAAPGTEKPPERRMGTELIAALQSSPYRELDIVPPRLPLTMPLRDVTF